ncbi:cupin domain-containing protein [Streptacidiphilus anmyonensis]|uniref:cupin domain-containing protein n=1 Tax=Streptacidiphilus anmyonensis TaxID=405782 RepID=UPI0005AB83AC|nr:cupin domain-containing protein [Streptacidiphilus anmyonensis]
MAVVLHRAEKAELGAFAPKPTSTTEGQQEALCTVWTAPEGVEAGVWEATPGRFTATREGYHEVCQILSGRATVTPTGGEPVEIGPGDTLVTPAGWTGVWEVHETLRKTYVTIDLPASPPATLPAARPAAS